MNTRRIQHFASIVMLLAWVLFMPSACSKHDESVDISHAVSVATGTYRATITPTMGTQKMAQGIHPVKLEAVNDTQIRIHFEDFNAPMMEDNGQLSTTKFMPFMVSVDFLMEVKTNRPTEITFKSIKGTFVAKPKNGKQVSESEIPEGILPPNMKGFSTDKAEAEGSIKDGKLKLNVSPKILPVTIIIEGIRE